MRAIENLIAANRANFGGVEFTEANFLLVDYVDAKGERRPAYRMTRDGFALLAMGFTGQLAIQFKVAYISAFRAMEAKLAERVAAQAAKPSRASRAQVGHHIVGANNMVQPAAPLALPAPGTSDPLRHLLTHGLPAPAANLTPEQAALVNRRAMELTLQANELLRDHLLRIVAWSTTPTSRNAPPEHRGSLARALASTTLHTALAGPIRHAAQDATHMIEVAERALTMTLQDLRAAKGATPC